MAMKKKNGGGSPVGAPRPLIIIAAVAAFVIIFLYMYSSKFGCSSTPAAAAVFASGGDGDPASKRQTLPAKQHDETAAAEVISAPPVDPEMSRLQDFAPLLEAAAMHDRTVLLTEVNQAWAAPGSILDYFLESFKVGIETEVLLNHLIVVAMDPLALERCKAVHRHCYLLRHGGDVNFTSEKTYMSQDYLELVWTKVKLWQFILEKGYSFFFTDSDIVYFRNPLRQVSVYYDLTLAADIYIGMPEDHGNYPNTGMVYAKPTQRNIEMLKYWHGSRHRFPPTNEQTVYDKIKRELAATFDLKIKYVDTAFWGNLCQPKIDYAVLTSMHAACREGMPLKLSYMKQHLQEWKDFRAAFLSGGSGDGGAGTGQGSAP